MLTLYRTLSLRYLRQHWPRTLLVVVSIALGVATWIATSALNQSMIRAIRLAATPLGGAADLYVGNGEAGVPLALAERIEAVPGVRAVKPLVIERVVLPELGDGARNQSATLLGVERKALDAGDPSWGVKVHFSSAAGPVQALFAEKPALIGAELAARLPTDGRGRFRILAAGESHWITPVGTVEASGPAAALGGQVLVMELTAAAALLGRPGRASRFDLSLAPEADRDEVQHRLTAALDGQARVETLRAQDQRLRNVLGGLEVGFTVSGACALLVGMFLVYNALSVNVAERRHDIGVMRSLGAMRGQVAGLFVGEAAVLGAIGSVLGLPIGLGLAYVSLGPVQEVLRDIFVPIHSRQIVLSPRAVVFALLAGLTASVLAGLVPAVRAASEEPADAVRRVPRAVTAAFRLLQVGACLLLVAAGLGLMAFKERLPERLGTYAGLVLVMLAGLLSAPLLALVLARLLQPLTRRLPGVGARLAADNLVRAPGRTGLVIAALSAGVALVVQTAGIIKSNKDAYMDWVDRSITADLFVTSGGPLTGSSGQMAMPLATGERLQELVPGAHTIPVHFRHVEPYQGAGGPTIVYLVAFDTRMFCAANRERHFPHPELALLRRLADEPGTVLVSENFALMHGVEVGDTIELPGADGPVRPRVIGTIVDYSWNRGTVYAHRGHYVRDFRLEAVNAFDVYLPPSADVATAQRRIAQSPLGAEQSLFVLTRQDLRQHIQSMLERLYGLAYTQEVMVALVVALGVVMALLISVLQRRRELGLLRAVGATQGQVLRSVLAEALLMGLIGTAIGLVMGIPLEWYAVRVILFEEAGFLFPIGLPWAEAVVIAALAVLLALAAGLMPAVQAVRLHIADAIAYE